MSKMEYYKLYSEHNNKKIRPGELSKILTDLDFVYDEKSRPRVWKFQ